jgi:hypothetical protein
MSAFHPDLSPHPIHTVHRIGAAAIGGLLLLFAACSLLLPVGFLPGSSAVVWGLATSGLLAVVSLVVGAVLVVAAVRGGPTASSVSLVVGAGFLLSGIGNALVLGTAMNMLGFQLSNVLFSLVVGLALLLIGAYGRFTGSLPDDSPYATPSVTQDAPALVDPVLAAALAAAERAVAAHAATPAQAAGVAAAARYGSHAERSDAFARANTVRRTR